MLWKCVEYMLIYIIYLQDAMVHNNAAIRRHPSFCLPDLHLGHISFNWFENIYALAISSKSLLHAGLPPTYSPIDVEGATTINDYIRSGLLGQSKCKHVPADWQTIQSNAIRWKHYIFCNQLFQKVLHI